MPTGLHSTNQVEKFSILSALGQIDDRVKGLRAGGDDYLAKPYSFSELLARSEAMRHHSFHSITSSA
jgi:two-component system, OmpR family, response regulator